MRNAAVTICSTNYLAKALVLQQTYQEHHPNDDFFLVLVDRKDPALRLDVPRGQVVWIEDLGLPDFRRHAFAYDIIELNTSVKPSVLSWLLERYESAIYLDPDICVYAPLDPVFEALASDASVVVTPHTTTPILDGAKPDDLELLRFGGLNLGFIGARRCPTTSAFLRWWSDRCLAYGFYEPQSGLAVDQKWMDLAPVYFEGVRILRDPGLNVAFWNLHERTIGRRDGRWTVNESWPVRFVHFSSFETRTPRLIAHKQSRFPPGSRPDFEPLAQEYARLLGACAAPELESRPYGFDFFEDGARVTPALRRFYAALGPERFPEPNPFARDGEVRRFAARHALLGKDGPAPRRETFQDLSSYRREQAIIFMLLRWALRVLGPTRYFNLMRFLGYVSSLRNQGQLFEATERGARSKAAVP